MKKHVPNILTIVRFLLIPLILISIGTEKYILAFSILTISGITDILDGFIARRFDLITNFGKLMDPLADKCTQVSILVVLTMKGIIPFWILIIVVLKEFVMIAGASFLYGKELVVSSKWYGKAATVIFYFAIVCSLFIRQFNFDTNSAFYNIDSCLYYLALATTLFSLAMYFKAFYVQGYFKKDNLTIKK